MSWIFFAITPIGWHVAPPVLYATVANFLHPNRDFLFDNANVDRPWYTVTFYHPSHLNRIALF